MSHEEWLAGSAQSSAPFSSSIEGPEEPRDAVCETGGPLSHGHSDYALAGKAPQSLCLENWSLYTGLLPELKAFSPQGPCPSLLPRQRRTTDVLGGLGGL